MRISTATNEASFIMMQPLGASMSEIESWVRGDLPACLRLLARRGERHRRRQRLGIDLEVKDRGLAGSLRCREGGKEIRGPLHRRAVAAEGPGIGRKIRIPQTGCYHSPGIVALLVHANGAVHTVVDDNDDDRQLVLHRGREFLASHEEIAVAGKGNYGAFRR